MANHALTLHDRLEQTRLLHRETRLKLVLAALGDRVRELDRHGKRTPEPLLAALDGFREELETVRGRLASRQPHDPVSLKRGTVQASQ
jgi:hypothetical protein